MRNRLQGKEGFTLIELLVVVAIVGMVMTSVFGLYISSRSSASTQEEVVELQQSLRISLDQMARDIRGAGFMIPAGDSPVSVATANSITLQTSTETGRMARVVGSFSTAGPTDEINVPVAAADMVDFFGPGDWVRIIRPPNKTEPLDDTYQVASVDRSVPHITLTHFGSSGIQYRPGDIMIRVETETGTVPVNITYGLSGDELLRNGESMAEGITALQFSYILDNGSETAAPADPEDVKAVRITVTGDSEDKGQGSKTRSMTQLVSLRNK